MKVMNACPLKPEKYDQVVGSSKYIIEEKLKGIRATVIFGKYSNIITSRGGHDISHRFPHIANALYPNYIGITLDGELFQRGIEDEIISGWGNHRTKNIDASITRNVCFYYFDIIETSIQLLSRKIVIHEYNKVLDLPFIHVDWLYQTSHDITLRYYNKIISEGGEGIMLKYTHALYIPGKRPQNNWYKMKKTKTFEVIIIGFEMAEEYSIKKGDTEETETKFKGLVGAFRYGIPDGTDVVRALGTCSGMDDVVRKDMTYHPERWIGKIVEVEGVEQKKSGCVDNPRFKRRRDDKLIEDITEDQC